MWKIVVGLVLNPDQIETHKQSFSGSWECASLYPFKIAITPRQYARNAMAAKMEVKIYILANIQSREPFVFMKICMWQSLGIFNSDKTMYVTCTVFNWNLYFFESL